MYMTHLLGYFLVEKTALLNREIHLFLILSFNYPPLTETNGFRFIIIDEWSLLNFSVAFQLHPNHVRYRYQVIKLTSHQFYVLRNRKRLKFLVSRKIVFFLVLFLGKPVDFL